MFLSRHSRHDIFQDSKDMWHVREGCQAPGHKAVLAHCAEAMQSEQCCLYRCAIEEFKRSSDSWRSHAQTAANMRSEFAELLADDSPPAQNGQPDQHEMASVEISAEAGIPKKRKKSKAALAPDAVEDPTPEQANASKKQKRKAGDTVWAATAVPAAADGPQATNEQKEQELTVPNGKQSKRRDKTASSMKAAADVLASGEDIKAAKVMPGARKKKGKTLKGG